MVHGECFRLIAEMIKDLDLKLKVMTVVLNVFVLGATEEI
jgi:hypothetical protein